MNLKEFVLNSNIYISLAAVFLTLETQIQLGMKPQAHPYLFIIFFATLFEYNLHRLITVIFHPEALRGNKHSWVKKNLILFYSIVAVSFIGFAIAIALAKREVLMALAPIALITIFYSLPIFKNKVFLFRLREIPLLKIFMISFVWAAATIFLPIIQSGNVYNRLHVTWMLLERFAFVFAITIPFDIRDMVIDRQSGLKTIPILVGKKWSVRISNAALLLFLAISFIHYGQGSYRYIFYAFIVSTVSTLIFINNKKLKEMRHYHYGLLDGTLLLQGLLVLAFYFFIQL